MAKLFDFALLCWPSDRRDRDGELVVDTAKQLVADGRSSSAVEAIGIARSGFALRLSSSRFASAPWSDAAALLLMPLIIVALVATCSQLLLMVPGYPTRFLNPGFSSTLPLGLLLLALAATAARKLNLALAATAGTFLLLIGRIYRAESLGGVPGIQHDLSLTTGGMFNIGVNADAALLPVIFLAVVCCLILRRDDRPVHYLTAGVTLFIATSFLLVAWAVAEFIGPSDTVNALNQIPVMFLLWGMPVLFFAISTLTRAEGQLRLAASLSLMIAGPALTWIIAGLPTFYNWPDAALLALLLGLQLIWIGTMFLGIAGSGERPRSRHHSTAA